MHRCVCVYTYIYICMYVAIYICIFVVYLNMYGDIAWFSVWQLPHPPTSETPEAGGISTTQTEHVPLVGLGFRRYPGPNSTYFIYYTVTDTLGRQRGQVQLRFGRLDTSGQDRLRAGCPQVPRRHPMGATTKGFYLSIYLYIYRYIHLVITLGFLITVT